MERRRRQLKDFSKFPTPEIDSASVVVDIRNRDYMSKFKEFHVRTVFYLALLGMTNEQMAVVFDINASEFNSWLHKFPTFLEALKKGKEQADSQVVYSLYQAAIGFEHDSEQIFMSKERTFGKDAQGRSYVMKETPKIIRVPIVKKYPPSVKAALRWLEIRQPDQWSDRENKRAKVSIIQNNYDIHDLSTEELKVLQKIGLQNNPVEDAQFQTTTHKSLKEIPIEAE
jgi:hypothetical protein